MIEVDWLLLHLLSLVGFFLAFILMVHQSRESRPPSSTTAWLLAILLIPYLGVPAYLIFGGRKFKRLSGNKPDLTARPTASGTIDIEKLFPQRSGHEITMLSHGEEAFNTLLQLIEKAEKNIEITTFILGRDETGAAVLEALTRQLGQGVRVRLLLDALGSFRISKKRLAPFLAAGGQCAFFMPMLHLPFRGRANLRNHRKMVIVDNQTAMVGGMNLAREYMGRPGRESTWRDLSFLVKGPVLTDLIKVFNSDWRFAAKQKSKINDYAIPKIAPLKGQQQIAIQLLPSGPDITGDPLYEKVISAIFKARRRLWIVTPYFIPDELALKSLEIAARHGINVKIFLPRVSNHRLADLARGGYLRQLQKSGADILLYKPGMLHAKVILIDDELAVLGSMNMDLRSFFLNYEIALFVHDDNLVKQLESWITELGQHSAQGVKKVSSFFIFWEEVARLLSPLL